MKVKNKILPQIIFLLFVSFFQLSEGIAASVKAVSMYEMLQASQFVFEGTVQSIEAKEGNNKRIYTYVTFAIQDIIKGRYLAKTITLRFMGGTVGDVAMVISDMDFLETGEHGIYFVESLKRHQVNPLYGWQQGHFLVEPDGDTGTERILTRDKQPVTEIQRNSSGTSAQGPGGLSTGVARGLEIGPKGAEGMPLDQFKKVLREQLTGSR